MAQITQLTGIGIPGQVRTFLPKLPATEEVVVSLSKDLWTQVLAGVTFFGQVFILPQENEPTRYLVALVDAGDPAPELDFEGGIFFTESFTPANYVPSDYYVMPKTHNGRVAIIC